VRAAALTEDHRFTVVDLPDPTPGPGELVLRVAGCGICGSDLKAHAHLPAGTVMGHELCGEVVAVGAGVEGWREGQAAASLPMSSCGTCRWCLAGEPFHCHRVRPFGFGAAHGAFAELVQVDAGLSLHLPAGLGPIGALAEPLAVGLHGVTAVGIRPGERVLVLGGGNVGASVSTWARRLGAGEVVVSDPSPTRRDAVLRVGATATHDPATGPPPTGFDVVVECVGAPGMVQAAVDAAGVRGRIAVVGVCEAPDTFVPVGAVLKELRVAFAVYYRLAEWTTVVDLLARGELDTDAFVRGTVGLDAVGESFDALLAGRTDGKVIVTP
jgi:(R,R)-butanediol dehydrogenase/meso-butanediol dehydrogenase/diacetyl reductase